MNTGSMRQYFDLTLRLNPLDSQRCLAILEGPGGQAEATLYLPPADAAFVQLIHDLDLGGLTADGMQALGTRLWQALWVEPLAGVYARSQARCSPEQALRIRLQIPPEATLLGALPWEYLLDPHQGPLVLTPTQIVRSPPQALPLPDYPLSHAPLRVLLTAARTPPDTEVARELTAIQEALAAVGQAITLVIEPHLTRTILQRRLREGFDLWHFVGHGGLDLSGTGVLVFEDATGDPDLVQADELGMLLHEQRLRLVVLSACSTAQSSGMNPYRGVALALVRAQVPALIAMRQAVSAETTRAFVSEFYRTLAEGAVLETSLLEGRRAIMNATGLERPDWGIPVLYTRAPARPLVEPLLRQAARKRIFISYKRDTVADEPLAHQLADILRRDHEVFLDRDMPIGAHWAEQISAALSQSNAMIVLLSQAGVGSEMLREEVRFAHDLAQQHAGIPRILPVRVQFAAPLQYPLSEYLNPLQWARWEGPDDTPDLIAALQQALAGNQLQLGNAELVSPAVKPLSMPTGPLPDAQPRPVIALELPEGTMEIESQLYIQRTTDQQALSTLQNQTRGFTMTIKGPRQMGKSSLLMRVIAAAAEAGKQIAFLDFQLIDRAALLDGERFYRQFCVAISDALGLPDQTGEYWASPLGNSQRCTNYMGRYLLPQAGTPLLLAMDEVESVFDTSYRSDFFAMLRSWHNNRAYPHMPIWKKLDLALVTSTEPYQLIENLNQSPFNVGLVLDLEDFDAAQVADLNQRHGSPLNPAETHQLVELLGGHPYLTRRALYLLASGQWRTPDFFGQAASERGPFGDHLRYHLFRLHGRAELVRGLVSILRTGTCDDDAIFFRLRGAGLVHGERRKAGPRCRLYASYFAEHLQ